MHSSRLAELGSWVATNSEILIYGSKHQPMLAASSYWTASKNRIQHWTTALKMFSSDFEDPTPHHHPWNAFEIVVQEILLSEVLSRIWSATVLMHDHYQNTDELHGLAHSVHLSQLEAKNRAMRIMLKGQAEDEAAFDRVNRLRRSLERWTDVFLGQLPFARQASMFAFEPNRVLDFHREQQELAGEHASLRQRTLLASFNHDLCQINPYVANPGLNCEVAAGVIACYPTDRFDAYGLPKSVKMIWIEKAQNDTQMLVDHLADFETRAESLGC